MRITVLLSRRYRIAAVTESDGACPVSRFLEETSQQHEAHVAGIFTLLERIAEQGLDCLSGKLCHCVDKKHGIYELIKGRIRIFFFKGDKGIVLVATNGIIKKSQKTRRNDIHPAIAAKEEYEQARRNGNLIIETEEL